MIQINTPTFIGVTQQEYNNNTKSWETCNTKTYLSTNSISYFKDCFILTDKEDFTVIESAEEIMGMIEKSTRFIDN